MQDRRPRRNGLVAGTRRQGSRTNKDRLARAIRLRAVLRLDREVPGQLSEASRSPDGGSPRKGNHRDRLTRAGDAPRGWKALAGIGAWIIGTTYPPGARAGWHETSTGHLARTSERGSHGTAGAPMSKRARALVTNRRQRGN